MKNLMVKTDASIDSSSGPSLSILPFSPFLKEIVRPVLAEVNIFKKLKDFNFSAF